MAVEASEDKPALVPLHRGYGEMRYILIMYFLFYRYFPGKVPQPAAQHDPHTGFRRMGCLDKTNSLLDLLNDR